MPGRRDDLFLNPPVFSIPSSKPSSSSSSSRLKAHQSARKFHIRRLNDIVHLCIQRGDFLRANAAFSVLARCREIYWVDIWKLGLAILAEESETHELHAGPSSSSKKVQYLKAVILESKAHRVEAMKELLLIWITAGEHQVARDYLVEEYLTTYPFFDSSTLQTYGGLISLYLAQEVGSSQNTLSQALLYQTRTPATPLSVNHLRAAKEHFEQALRLDKNNSVAQSFIDKLMPQFQMYGIRVGIEVSSAQLPSAASTTLHRKAPSGQDSESDDEQEPSWARSESPQEHAEPSSSGGPQGARLDGAASESDSESQSDASSRGSQANVVLEASRKQAHTPGPQISLDDLSLASRSRPHTPNRTPSAATTPHAPSTPPTQHKVSRNLAARGTFSVPSHSNTSHPNVPGPSSRRIHSRKSFAELHEQGSPEKVDHTVYVEDNALYFDSSPIRGRAGVGLSSYGGGEDDSDGRANAANDEEDEMDLDDEDVPAWAR